MKPRLYFCRLPRRILGDADTETGVIRLDFNKNSNPVYILLHELIHLQHPTWKEQRVIDATARQWERLSVEKKYKLGKFLFCNIKRWDGA